MLVVHVNCSIIINDSIVSMLDVDLVVLNIWRNIGSYDRLDVLWLGT